MKIIIAGTEFELFAKKTQECPAGTAYWYMGVFPVVTGGELTVDAAFYGENTKAMYGAPDVIAFAERAKPIIADRLRALAQDDKPAAALGRTSSPAKTAAARENAKKPRPSAQGKPKPRKPKAE
jgi:hypothetical protein